MEQRKIPVFETEAEEAQWWYDNREELAQDFTNAGREGRLGPGSVARLKAKRAAASKKESEENLPRTS